MANPHHLNDPAKMVVILPRAALEAQVLRQLPVQGNTTTLDLGSVFPRCGFPFQAIGCDCRGLDEIGLAFDRYWIYGDKENQP